MFTLTAGMIFGNIVEKGNALPKEEIIKALTAIGKETYNRNIKSTGIIVVPRVGRADLIKSNQSLVSFMKSDKASEVFKSYISSNALRMVAVYATEDQIDTWKVADPTVHNHIAVISDGSFSKYQQDEINDTAKVVANSGKYTWSVNSTSYPIAKIISDMSAGEEESKKAFELSIKELSSNLIGSGLFTVQNLAETAFTALMKLSGSLVQHCYLPKAQTLVYGNSGYVPIKICAGMSDKYGGSTKRVSVQHSYNTTLYFDTDEVTNSKFWHEGS